MRYDELARTQPDLLHHRPANWTSPHPSDGVTALMETELTDPVWYPRTPVPKKESIFDVAVRDRCKLTTTQLQAQRARDINLAMEGMESDSLCGTIEGIFASDALGLDAVQDFEIGPLGGRGALDSAVEVRKEQLFSSPLSDDVSQTSDAEGRGERMGVDDLTSEVSVTG